MAYRTGDFDEAVRWLERCLNLRRQPSLTIDSEPTISSLGHAYRKQRRYGDAIRMFQQALGLCPVNAGTYAALGYSYHLSGDLPAAIQHYHKALALRIDDTFTAELLTAALQQECGHFVQ